MTLLDAVHAAQGVSTSVAIEFQSDALGTWVDFNQLFGGYGDYTEGLTRLPMITKRTEKQPGQYVATVTPLQMYNGPWVDNEYGIWDAPISKASPIAVGNGTFSSWYRRKVRIKVTTRYANGNTSVSTRGTFLIDRPITTHGEIATIPLIGFHEVLMTRSAATVKDGASWFKGLTIPALAKRLVNAGFPGMQTDIPDAIDLGLLDEARATSWGAVPGVLSDKDPSVFQWIPRCFCKDPDNDSRLYVGFEVPGDRDQSDGALAYFDVDTHHWTILVTHEDSGGLQGRVPRQIHITGNFLMAIVCWEETVNHPVDPQFYMQQYGYSKTTGGGQGASGTVKTWHPARETLREGFSGVTWNELGTQVSGASNHFWYGEPPVLTVPQTVDDKQAFSQGYGSDPGDGWYGLTSGNTIGQREAWWTGVKPYPGETADINSPTAAEIYFDAGAFPKGSWRLLTTHIPSGTVPGFFRYYMSDSWSGLPLRWKNNDGNQYWYWVGKPHGSDDFDFHRMVINAGDVTDRWPMDNLRAASPAVGNTFWERQITAFSLAANQVSAAVTSTRFYLATIDWNNSSDGTNLPWSRTAIYKITLPTFAGQEVTVSEQWNEAPSGNAETLARVFTQLWAPYSSGSEQDADGTRDAVIGVVLNRADVSGQPFGVAIGECDSTGDITNWLSMPGDAGYTGPTSSLPFAGFTTEDGQGSDTTYGFWFVDQATGQIWRGAVSTSLNKVTWSVVNKGMPLHTKETFLSATYGETMTPAADGEVRNFWPTAPSPAGDVVNGYWQHSWNKPSSRTHVPGLYPLVMFSKAQADIIEVAEMSGLKCWDALGMLRDIPDYRMYVAADGTLTINERTAGSPAKTIKFLSRTGYADASSGEIGAEDGAKRRILYEHIKNAIEVTPYALGPNGEPSIQVVRAGGSGFSGDFMVEVHTTKAIRVAVNCVSGGDPVEQTEDEQIPAILFRYTRILETIHIMLAVGCQATDTAVTVSGLTLRAGEWWAGDVKVSTLDSVQVMDGTKRQITVIDRIGYDAARLTIAGATDVAAQPYSEVSIIPADQSGQSDGSEGVTTLAAALDASETAVTVTDGSTLRSGMVIKVTAELMRIQRVLGNTVDVTRGSYNSLAEAHAVDSVVKGYVGIHHHGVTYAVGNTGISLGLAVDADADRSDRTIAPGDGVVVTGKGFKLQPMEHAVIRAVDSTSIDLYERQDLAVDKNRFVDPVKAETMGGVKLTNQALPRIGVFGIPIPFTPDLDIGVDVTIDDERIIPGGVATTFEIQGIKEDLDKMKMYLDVKAYDAITGAGGETAKPGKETRTAYAVPRGRARRARQ